MLCIRPLKSRPGWSEYIESRARTSRDERLRQFFEAGIPDPDTPVSRVSFTALDLETTGLDVNQHGIVSIGMVPFSIDRIRSGHSYYRIVRPRRMLRDESVVIHHITHSEIASAPDFIEVLGELLGRLAGSVPVVHYHPIERCFLDEAIKARLGERFLCPMVDTMNLEARWHRESLGARVRNWLGSERSSIRLHESRERYSLPFYYAHHALTDALASAELFQAQIAHRFDRETRIGDLWL